MSAREFGSVEPRLSTGHSSVGGFLRGPRDGSVTPPLAASDRLNVMPGPGVSANEKSPQSPSPTLRTSKRLSGPLMRPEPFHTGLSRPAADGAVLEWGVALALSRDPHPRPRRAGPEAFSRVLRVRLC